MVRSFFLFIIFFAYPTMLEVTFFVLVIAAFFKMPNQNLRFIRVNKIGVDESSQVQSGKWPWTAVV